MYLLIFDRLQFFSFSLDFYIPGELGEQSRLEIYLIVQKCALNIPSLWLISDGVKIQILVDLLLRKQVFGDSSVNIGQAHNVVNSMLESRVAFDRQIKIVRFTKGTIESSIILVPTWNLIQAIDPILDL